MALDSSSLNEQVSNNRTDGETHGCVMELFITPTLEEEIGILGRILALL